MPLRDPLKGLQPAVKAAADWTLNVARYYGVPVTVTSGFRSMQQQKALYEAYRAGIEGRGPRTPWPANRPGDSAHNYGLAFDSVPVDRRYAGWWTAVREYAGFRVPPNDWPHAELPDWRRYVQ